MPSVNVTPSMTRGNCFRPLSLHHFLDAALSRAKTINFAVFCGSAPLARTVRFLRAANTQLVRFEVRKRSKCSAGKSLQASNALVSLVRQATPRTYLVAYHSLKVSSAACASARVPEWEKMRKFAATAGCLDFRKWFSTLASLWKQKR